MKPGILLILILGLKILCVGQTSKGQDDLKTLIKVDLGLQGIGFTFEPRLTKKTTLDISLGAGGGYDVWESGLSYEWNILQPAFYFAITPKYFYNRQKRIDKGKTGRFNSGNYVGIRLKYTTPSVAPNDPLKETLLMNLHWGLQRAIGGHWTLNFHIGPGYAQDVTSQFGTGYLAVDAKFSYNF